MNGVRRFLGGGGASSSSQPPPAPPPIQTTPPLAFSNKPSWPPTSPRADVSPSGSSTSPLSPSSSTAALFIKRDSKPRPSPTDDSPKVLPRIPKPVSATSRSNTPPTSTRSPISRRAVSSISPVKLNGTTWKNVSTLLDTRDDLLMSLLASEAVVDSREAEILSSEEVEELKKEQQVLSSRLEALTKKLTLETKIRDAALSLQNLHTTHKRMSKQTTDQLELANRKVDTAQRDLYRVSDRANEVQRKLLEHRAGVLCFSVRALEAKVESSSGEPLSGTTSRTSVTSAPGSSIQSKFDGAHLFAGHADAVMPGTPRASPSPSQVAALEEKLHAANVELDSFKQKQSQMSREISILKLEKAEIETTMGLDLQAATESVMALEEEVAQITGLQGKVKVLAAEKAQVEKERDELQARLKREGLGLDARRTETEKQLADIKSKWDADQLKWEARQAQWEQERQSWEEERLDDLARLQDEHDEQRKKDAAAAGDAAQQLELARTAMRNAVRSHGVVTSARDSSLPSLASALSAHLDGVKIKMDDAETLRKRLEDDVRSAWDTRERLGRDIEDARKEREDARREVRALEVRVKEQSDRFADLAQRATTPVITSPVITSPITPVDSGGDQDRVMSILRSLWASMPSPEARATRMGSRPAMRPKSPSSPRAGSEPAPSLSDLDVRSLKTLYDPRNAFPSPSHLGEFSLDSFVNRVQALLADDRALIERLIRFAQSHDLLKSNAERAQKLAQESTLGLETYAKQVKALEERNVILNTKLTELSNEVSRLQTELATVLLEKQDLEANAAEQAEVCRSLSEANNTLSTRALILAAEAASAPEAVRGQLETQLSTVKASLREAEDELDRIKNAQEMQRIALLDELNSMQKENSTLRDQLRLEQRKNGK